MKYLAYVLAVGTVIFIWSFPYVVGILSGVLVYELIVRLAA